MSKRLKLPFAEHEQVSAALIRDSEMASVLNSELGSRFAHDVATLLERRSRGNLYDAVVSSQFDADRLDYMQRDRLMTGLQSSGVDPVWLLANLEVASVPTGADNNAAGSVETLVLGPKAVQTAESYVVALFHLYPNVYLHKATRGAEQVFGAIPWLLFRRALHAAEQVHNPAYQHSEPLRNLDAGDLGGSKAADGRAGVGGCHTPPKSTRSTRPRSNAPPSPRRPAVQTPDRACRDAASGSAPQCCLA